MSVAGEIRQKLIDAGRILEMHGQGDMTRGHVSVRMPGDPAHFLMKPHSRGFDEITLENMVLCNLEGEKVAGGGRKHSEVYIHSEIYKARGDVNSVIHTHPAYAVALSATGQSLLPISQASVSFKDGLPYYSGTIELIRSQEKGAAVARALGACKAVLLRNHGVAVAGASLEESTMLALTLEEACKIQMIAQAGGGVGEMFAPELVQRLYKEISAAEQYPINFEFLRRKALRAVASGLLA